MVFTVIAAALYFAFSLVQKKEPIPQSECTAINARLAARDGSYDPII